ncbi:DUF5719 family protein [Microbacterium sp.]|uniref:DUF5719 family protein n=1 Tax=Microbacterium sp. TaxID=51671 RepID=UPI003A9020A1
MIRNRAIRVAATGARLLIGAAIAVGCVVAVVAAVALPWPGVAAEPAQVAVTPTAGDATLVCAGSFRAVGRNALDAAQQMPAGTPDLTVDSSGERTESTLEVPELSDTPGPQRFIASAEQGGAPLLAAAEAITLASDDLTGLAGAACREARTESWLVGGSVETGTNDLIVLSNPGDVTATATMTVFGLAQTSTTQLVPAGTQISVPLSSIAAGTQDPVVRITAAGAPLRATLQSSLIRTLDPSGIDLQDSAGPPSSTVVFAGVQVLAKSADTPLTVLRLLATDQATQARVTVRAQGAAVQSQTVPLEAGTPTEVNLDGLEPGVYSVEIEGDAPMAGAIRQAARAGAGSDFAWMTPAPDIHGETYVAIPGAAGSRVHLVNSGTADATVVLAPASDTDSGEEISIPAGGDALVEVDADSVYSLASDETIHAAVILAAADNALAGWPVWAGAAAQEPVTVYP